VHFEGASEDAGLTSEARFQRGFVERRLDAFALFAENGTMLACLSIVLPFNIAVSKTAVFSVYGYEWEGYIVRVFPPQYGEGRGAADPDGIKMNGEEAVLANIARIDFRREAFDRTEGGDIDPPAAVITHAIQSFVNRFRHVARGFNVRPPAFPRCAWRLEYRHDDGTSLEATKGLVSARGTVGLFAVSFVGLTPDIWTAIHDLPPEYEPPPWDVLLLDAQGELPKVGAAIVLAATALEVFIARVLDQLATEQALPKELWTWINERKDLRQQPTVEEQFDTLLKFLTTRSLKGEPVLWEGFQNLKQARNRFVHEGSARIGNTPVDAPRAGELIIVAGQIIAKIREWVPENLRWPTYEHKIAFEFSKSLTVGGAAKEQDENSRADPKKEDDAEPSQ
jgi:hypothetical protein